MTLLSQVSLIDLIYCLLRLTLAVLGAVAAVLSLRFAWQAWLDRPPWRVAACGGFLLGIGAMLSVYEAIDDVILRPLEPVALANWLWLGLFDLLLPVWALLLIAAWRGRDRALADVSRLSVTDQLTGALNRRGFMDRAAESIAQSWRDATPSALVMFDIDHFKSINDTHGHAAGDDVLRRVVAALAAAMRPGDLLGRIGGEEFAVLLYDSGEAVSRSVAERLRAEVRGGVILPDGRPVTVSGGVAVVAEAGEPETALSRALMASDEAMYAAKRAGRDRIMLAPKVLPAAGGPRAPEPAGV